MANSNSEKIPSNVTLVLLLLVLMLPFLSAIYLLDSRLDVQSQFIARQKTGIDYIKFLRRALEHVQQHRGMSNAQRSGSHEFDSQLSELDVDLEREIQELGNRYDRLGIISGRARKSMQWYEQWVNLQQQQGVTTAEDNFDAHSIQIGEYLGSLHDVAEAFSLTLDTDLKTRYLTEVIMRLPVQLENIAQMRGLGAGFVARAQIGKMEEKRLFSLGNIVSVEMESLVRDMDVLFRHDATLESRMTPIFDQGTDKTNRFLMMTYRELIEPDEPSISAAAYFAAGTAALNRFYSLFDAIHSELEGALVSRLADIRYKRILLWASSLLAVAVMTMIYYMFLRQQKKRQRLWRKLQEKEERLDLIMRGTRDGIWDWDLLHDRIYFSPRWKNMLGYDDDEVEDRFAALQALIHPDDLGLALAAWIECMEGEQDAFAVEYRMKTREGEYCWIQARGLVLLDERGNPVRMAGSHTDISNRKQASEEKHRTEDALRKSHAQLQEAHRHLQESHEQLLQSEKLASIGQLAAGVAHEINNPVGYVYSNLGTLQEYTDGLCRMLEGYEKLESLVAEDEHELQRLRDLKTRLDVDYLKDDVRNLVSESREGIARVKGIVQDLKDFSHVDEAEWQWTDLHRGLDSTLNIVNNEIKYKAKVIKEYGDLPSVECLASQINQVFMNLLVNAAHAIEEQGTITIRTGMQGENKVWVEISDTGSGISAENKKKIFDPFFTTKGVGKGTGLGLSLSYGIVHKHGGHISVDSEMGKGTRFRVSLPVSQPNQEQEKDSA